VDVFEYHDRAAGMKRGGQVPSKRGEAAHQARRVVRRSAADPDHMAQRPEFSTQCPQEL
jgi:hypothetical protein